MQIILRKAIDAYVFTKGTPERVVSTASMADWNGGYAMSPSESVTSLIEPDRKRRVRP